VNAGRSLIDSYYRRGWLSPGKFVAAIGLSGDLENLADVGNERPDARIMAQQRIDRVRALLARAQFDMLAEILFVVDSPSAWARLNGLVERRGLRELRDALDIIAAVYVADGTE
jgi:hypothetical protein